MIEELSAATFRERNPERAQDRAEDLIDNWRKYGYAMFPQQRSIYRQLGTRLSGRHVLEVGCGNGVGGAMLALHAREYVGTDKLEANVNFANELYPWLEWIAWDATSPRPLKLLRAQVTVAVEVLEHVADPSAFLRNLVEAAYQEVWISTPNGSSKDHPPGNPFHVDEYTPAEVLTMLGHACPQGRARIYGWDDLSKELDEGTDVDPLVYKVVL